MALETMGMRCTLGFSPRPQSHPARTMQGVLRFRYKRHGVNCYIAKSLLTILTGTHYVLTIFDEALMHPGRGHENLLCISRVANDLVYNHPCKERHGPVLSGAFCLIQLLDLSIPCHTFLLRILVIASIA